MLLVSTLYNICIFKHYTGSIRAVASTVTRNIDSGHYANYTPSQGLKQKMSKNK